MSHLLSRLTTVLLCKVLPLVEYQYSSWTFLQPGSVHQHAQPGSYPASEGYGRAGSLIHKVGPALPMDADDDVLLVSLFIPFWKRFHGGTLVRYPPDPNPMVSANHGDGYLALRSCLTFENRASRSVSSSASKNTSVSKLRGCTP